MRLPLRLEQALNAALHDAVESGAPSPHDAIWVMAAPGDEDNLYAAFHQRCGPTVNQAQSEASNNAECACADTGDSCGECDPDIEQWWIDLPTDDSDLRDDLIAWVEGAGDGYENMARAEALRQRVEAGPIGPSPFQAWMNAVDNVFQQSVGLTSRGLPDAPWRDWFMDELGPHDAVAQYAEDGWDDGMGLLAVLEDAGMVSP